MDELLAELTGYRDHCYNTSQWEVCELIDKALRELQSLREENERLRDVLAELVALMDDVVAGKYNPDSFTCQPAKRVLAEDPQLTPTC